jgi:hypothetical protein
MPRKPPAPVDTSRKLKGSKIFNGVIYSPGQEHELPKGFPMDGPHWADWEEGDEEHAAPTVDAELEQDSTGDDEVDGLHSGVVPELKSPSARPRKPRSKTATKRK